MGGEKEKDSTLRHTTRRVAYEQSRAGRYQKKGAGRTQISRSRGSCQTRHIFESSASQGLTQSSARLQLLHRTTKRGSAG